MAGSYLNSDAFAADALGTLTDQLNLATMFRVNKLEAPGANLTLEAKHLKGSLY